MASAIPKLDDPTPVRLPNIPKHAVFRRFCWDWLDLTTGDRWDHKGNPLGKSGLYLWQQEKALRQFASAAKVR